MAPHSQLLKDCIHHWMLLQATNVIRNFVWVYVFSGCHSYTGNGSNGKPIGILVGAVPISPQHGYFELGEKHSDVDLHFHFVSNQSLLFVST